MRDAQFNAVAVEVLRRNPAFPTPTSDDGAGEIVWNDADITGFGDIMASATSNGWQWTDAELADFDFATAASEATGPFYQKPAPLDFVE
jgi:hypothetical protein